MTSKRGGNMLKLNKTQGRGGGAKKSKGKMPNVGGNSNTSQSGPIPQLERIGGSTSPKPRQGVSLEELVKRTARANRFRDTLDPSQLLSVGGVVPHGRNSIVKIDGSPINPVDDFFEVLSIYHQTQMMIKQVNNTLPLVRKKLAWDFFHDETLPIPLSSLYDKDDTDKSKSFVEIENVDFIMEASKFPTKPKSLDLPTSPNFFDVEMEDVERFIATSPV
ncbi:34000_t:CDS:2, partial [Racocetra persica]